MSTCRACSAPIVWARTIAASKTMPLDADEHGRIRVAADGNVAVRPNLQLRAAPAARVLRNGEQPGDGEIRAVPHFATCTSWGRS